TRVPTNRASEIATLRRRIVPAPLDLLSFTRIAPPPVAPWAPRPVVELARYRWIFDEVSWQKESGNIRTINKKRAALTAPPRVWGGVQERGESGRNPPNLTSGTMPCLGGRRIDLDQACGAFWAG